MGVPIHPAGAVENLKVDSVAIAEVSLFTPTLDDSVFEVQLVTLATVAGTTTGDFFIVENAAGLKMAVWLDKAGTNSPPIGAIYSAADVKVRANISSDTTATTVSARVAAAMTAGGPIANLTRLDNLDGTITFTATKVGNVTAPSQFRADEGGAGSVVTATVTGGVASSLQNDYVIIRNDATTYHAWLNVNSEGTDPAPASSTAIAVTAASGATQATIAAAFAAAIDANANFYANVFGADQVQVRNVTGGTVTDISVTNATGFTASVLSQGAAANATGINPASSPESISNNPSAV